MLAIKILMEAIIIVGFISKQERCRSDLAGLMAAFKEFRVLWRITNFLAHRLAPTIGDRRQLRIYGCPEILDEIGQRVTEILIFSLSKTVPGHHNSTAEKLISWVEARDRPTLVRRKNAVDHCVALCIEILR